MLRPATATTMTSAILIGGSIYEEATGERQEKKGGDWRNSHCSDTGTSAKAAAAAVAVAPDDKRRAAVGARIMSCCCPDDTSYRKDNIMLLLM